MPNGFPENILNGGKNGFGWCVGGQLFTFKAGGQTTTPATAVLGFNQFIGTKPAKVIDRLKDRRENHIRGKEATHRWIGPQFDVVLIIFLCQLNLDVITIEINLSGAGEPFR